MKILFLGGTGNISADCAQLLAERGHEILALTRGRIPVPQSYQAVVADRHDLGALRAALRGMRPDVVINFIGFERSDLQTDFELFRNGVQQYIFISSTTVYSKPPRKLPITEDAPIGNPQWDYARKKVECERWLLEQWNESGFPATVVRPSHTYSRKWIPNALSSSSYTFARRLEQGRPVYIHDDGESPWTLTAAADFAVGLAGLVGHTSALGQAFHITSDEVLTWNEIYAEIAAALGVDSPQFIKIPTDFICEVAPPMSGTLKGDKAHAGVFNNAKIKQYVPGFHCSIPFRVGIRQSVAWLQGHPDQQQLNPDLDVLCDRIIAAWEHRQGVSP